MSGHQNLLARGASAKSSQPSPYEDLHSTVRTLLDENSQLKEKIEELEGDKAHFQRKLEEYIQSDRDDRSFYASRTSGSNVGDRTMALQSELETMKKENLRLISLLNDKGGLGGFQHAELEPNPVLLHQLSELRAARSLCVDQHERKIEAMKLEKFRLKEEVERLRRTVQLAESASLQSKRGSWEALNGHFYTREGAGGEGGYSSLPETLPSYSSTSTGQSTSSNITGAEDPLLSEVKKLKKQLEKYKSVNVELDQKLKDAHLDLRRLTEGRGKWNMTQQMDVERLEGEVSRLRAQLDQLHRENSHLRSMAGRHM